MARIQNAPPQNPESLSDAVLFDRLQQGQSWALSVIYDRHSPMLYGLALKILKNPTLAQDVLQDVFVKIWKSADSYNRKRGVPLAWMTVLCRNRCIDLLRSKDLQTERRDFMDESRMGEMEQYTDPGESPLNQADLSLLSSTVKRALASLPVEQKDLLEKAYYEGFTQSELAKSLKIPLGTVKTRMRLGMQKLKQIFERVGIE